MSDDKPLPAAPPRGIAEPMILAPIPLHPQSTRASAPPPAKPKEPEQKDSYRELIETVVFVVVLVLMLKTFLAEAFVIPTGSMADTLMGYHHKVTCLQCGYTNLVNASEEVEPQHSDKKRIVTRCQCENCGYWNNLQPQRELPRAKIQLPDVPRVPNGPQQQEGGGAER